MRCVVQRLRSGSVDVDGRTVGKIGEGLLVLCGFLESDTEKVIDWMVNKLANLRVFNDSEGRLNRSVRDIGGAVLVVSNFTLYGDASNGMRPSFSRSAKGEISRPMYDYFVKKLAEVLPTETGRFGEHMELLLDFNGPVTLVIDK